MGVFDKLKLTGKVALVTGGGKNLGKVIAVSLAEAGADVVVTSRTLSEVEKSAEEIRGKGRRPWPSWTTNFRRGWGGPEDRFGIRANRYSRQ
jgi:NAD(P)-dependent dehydrogenase (short-subunit alcohol dehydrogenase family)